MTRTKGLRESSRLFRGPVARGAQRIERDGGEYGAGIIRQASIIMRGPALGHGVWVDDVMLSQTADAINDTAKGVKGRFAHPNESADGLGKLLGRWQSATVQGDKVLADLHFIESAHRAPDGDLAEYIMKLAEEDPEAFGVSISFRPDYAAEELFVLEHTDKKNGNFESPDDDNSENMPHARLAELEAADAVDAPAANPDGLFHRGNQVLFDADALLEFCFCNGPAPNTVAFGIAPDRIRGFAQRWLERKGLRLIDYRAMRARARAVELDSD